MRIKTLHHSGTRFGLRSARELHHDIAGSGRITYQKQELSDMCITEPENIRGDGGHNIHNEFLVVGGGNHVRKAYNAVLTFSLLQIWTCNHRAQFEECCILSAVRILQLRSSQWWRRRSQAVQTNSTHLFTPPCCPELYRKHLETQHADQWLCYQSMPISSEKV